MSENEDPFEHREGFRGVKVFKSSRPGKKFVVLNIRVGNDGGAEILLYPEQARIIARSLNLVASAIDAKEARDEV